MPVGKRIYLKRQMPDPKVVAGFKRSQLLIPRIAWNEIVL